MPTNTPCNPTENPTSTAVRDSVYFLEPVIFEVEDVLFKVPKYYFAQKSDVFESMFSVPQPPGADLEGSNENAPLKLEQVSRTDFRKLLEVMYPLEPTKTLWSTMTKEGWISVLKLATMWNFRDIRELAINKLTNEPMEPVEQILLARAHMVPQWLRAVYSALAIQNNVLSSAEAEGMGYPTAVLLFQVREQIRKDGWANHQCRSPGYYGDYKYSSTVTVAGGPPVGDASKIIEMIFEKELRAMEGGYNA